jgi:hypothetical protein
MSISLIVEDKKVTIADIGDIRYRVEEDDENLVNTVFVVCERYVDNDDSEVEEIEEEEDEDTGGHA